MYQDEQIGPDHVFTVLDATACPSAIVMVGDEQAWNPGKECVTGTLSVTRDDKPVEFWATKVFRVDRFDKNRYSCTFTEGSLTTIITLVFERGRHLSLHMPVWMIYGDCSTIGPDGIVEGGPPDWGGQNAQ